MVNRDLNDDEFKRGKKVNICKGKDFIDNMLTYKNKKRKGDPKIIKIAQILDMKLH